MMMIQIENMQPHHWPQVKTIYQQGIDTGHATFETTAPEWEAWDKSHLAVCRLVAQENGDIIGWAALSPVSARVVYAGVAEVSIYISSAARGKGLGRQLLQKLVEESEAHGFWTLQASIYPENIASLYIHENCGFRVLGRRERIAKRNGVWRDTVLLERRSKVNGL